LVEALSSQLSRKGGAAMRLRCNPKHHLA
jgi:hypothetical protein